MFLPAHCPIVPTRTGSGNYLRAYFLRGWRGMVLDCPSGMLGGVFGVPGTRGRPFVRMSLKWGRLVCQRPRGRLVGAVCSIWSKPNQTCDVKLGWHSAKTITVSLLPIPVIGSMARGTQRLNCSMRGSMELITLLTRHSPLYSLPCKPVTLPCNPPFSLELSPL